MEKRYSSHLLTILLLLVVVACGGNKKAEAYETERRDRTTVIAPPFNADSAYVYVKAQVDFGPRVPGTAAHDLCAQHLANELRRFGATVTVQTAEVATYDGHLITARNIIGSYNPETKRRVALFAHWDSRPWADQDPDEGNQQKPVMGANDGASGVGVLLEIARQLQMQPTEIGVDLILLDAEDYGANAHYEGQHLEEYWCLGSQYWARNPHVAGYKARFGILLDMVGGHDAVFRYEMVSEQYAKNINRKVWKAANELGFDQFVKRDGHYTTDDHVFVNRIARIPTIDIIPFSEEYSFFEHWHTTHDDMDAIAPETLRAVGQTVMQVIYNEK